MNEKINALKNRYPNIAEDIIELQGNPFVTYEGLLNEAHRLGLIGIETEPIQFPNAENGNTCIFKAIVIGKDKKFTGYGDANPTNVNRNIAKHLIRMAETRAKARALRDFTNIGITSTDELDSDDIRSAKKEEKSANDNNLITNSQISLLLQWEKENKTIYSPYTNQLLKKLRKNTIYEFTEEQAEWLISILSEKLIR